MDEGEAVEPRYTAFLSYSHKDAGPAARLHRRLETYKLPKRRVGTMTASGPVPERLWPIFRDREELPAATDLSETVREALARSGSLIILCSPNAATSLWVAEEIQTFRKLHPGRPILAAILSGDPPSCFPEALRAFGQDGTWHEPLATDLRRGGDGPQLGLLKLVAGITGIGLDDLVQRDAQRRIRRVMSVTALAVLAMLVTGALAIVAINARWEADRQRAKAEGQIEFMLTDLRSRLKGVGSLEIMTSVNRQALTYYQGQDLTGLPAESLERRARILHAIGEDEKTRGHLEAALTAFREAHRITAEQLNRSPLDPERNYAHSQSEYWIGSIDEQRGNYPAALAAYRRYHARASQMNTLAPDNPRYVGELAYAESNLGIVDLIGFNRPRPARENFQRSLRAFVRASRLEPANITWRVETADAHAWIADTWFAERRFEDARRERLIEQRLKLDLIRDDPNNRAYLFAGVATDRALARIDQELGEYESALSVLEGARTTMDGLLRRDQQNQVWRDVATRIEADPAQLFVLQRQPGAAATALQKAFRLLDEGDRLASGRSALREQLRERIGDIQRQLSRLQQEEGNGHE